MKNFTEMLSMAIEKGPIKIAIAAADDIDVLKAVKRASELKLAEPILVGNKERIKEKSERIEFNLSNVEIIDEADINEASRKAVSLVSEEYAGILMKGLVDTSILLRAVLDNRIGLRSGNVLSHTAIFKPELYHKILCITDAAMNIAPDAEQKVQILKNTLKLYHSMSFEMPKVAIVCAKEKVSKDMQSTLDAEILVNLYKEGKIKGCILDGPFGLDNAISKEAAEHKGIQSVVAGDADILVMPNIDAGNVLYKSLTYFSKSENAGIVLGAKAPIVLTSRADSEQAKLNSIALAVLYAGKRGEENE